MQFGHVLAFATLVLASPTPILEDRDNSGPLTSYFASAIKSTSDYLNSNVDILKKASADIQAASTSSIKGGGDVAGALIGGVAASLAAFESSLASLVVSDAQSVSGSVSADPTAFATALYNYLTSNVAGGVDAGAKEVKALSDAVNTLVKQLSNSGLVTASATATSNLGTVAQASIAALKGVVEPLTTLQASLTTAVSSGGSASVSSAAAALYQFAHTIGKI